MLDLEDRMSTRSPEPWVRPSTTLRLDVPATPPELVVRRPLVGLLRRGTRGPLTLVSAPAGYGKTALVSSWAASVRSSVTVVDTVMHEDDCSPAVFWTSAIEAVRVAGVDVSGVPAPARPDGVDRSMLAGLARSINAHRGPVVWVVDCDEFALPTAVGEAVHRLIEECPEQLRVVLLTRADPPLPLHRYRLSGTLTEIRAADLAFGATEASTLLQRAGLDLAPVDAVMLRSRTGGWPAGLKFAAMTLLGRVDTAQAIRDFRGDTGNVAAYLMSEVYAKQPPRIREFLLRTCLVDQLTPGLASALTGQSCEPGVLQFVANGNSFLESVPGQPGSYRYQSLFREFLRSQLAFEHPELKAELHRKAAEWLAEEGQPLAALQHAVLAEAWPVATRILVDGLWFGGLLVGGRRSLLRDLFARMPRDAEGAEPAVTRAALALADQDAARCAAELAVARESLASGAAAGPRMCALAISVLEAVSTGLGADVDTGLDQVMAAEDAFRSVPPEVRGQHPEVIAILARSKATVLLQRGELSAALEALDEGIRAAEAPHLGDVLQELQGMAALVCALKGELRQSEKIAGRLLPTGVGGAAGAPDASPAALAALAWIRLDEYDLHEAHTLLRTAETGTAPSYDARVVESVLALLRARLFAVQRRFGLARATLRAASLRSGERSAPGWLDRALALGEANVLLSEGSPQQAVAVARGIEGGERLDRDVVLHRALLASGSDAEELVEPSTRTLENAPLGVQVDTWLALAEQAVTNGDDSRAEVCVQRALRLAAPERLRRPFLEAGDELSALFESGGLSSHTRWLRASAHAEEEVDVPPEYPGASGPGRLLNPLTKKELEVLGHLAELLTTEEIAETMYVSVNTVRSHVRNILRKLGVARRNEAVRRAWELHLLPPPNVA
jgi:LuxR family maltose regulon positive regulatory protein